MGRYSDETKAKVISEWQAGTSYAQIKATYGVPLATVQRWTSNLDRVSLQVTKKSLQDYDFDAAAENLIDGSVRAFASILRAAEDPAWIKGHSPSEAAILAGVIADKLYRLLGAVERPHEAVDAILPERASSSPQPPVG